MRNVDAPKHPPRFHRNPINERTTGKKSRRAKKRLIFSTVLFVSVLLGTCLFLGSVVLPNVTDSTPPNADRASEPTFFKRNSETRIREAEAETRTYGNRISVTGVGRVMDDTAQSKLLGRRAAITDARRKLLIQRQKLIGNPSLQESRGTTSVSGFLSGAQRITNEGVRGDIYFVEVEMSLGGLLHSDFDEDRFASELDDLLARTRRQASHPNQ